MFASITFRPLERSDFEHLARWFSADHIRAWFNEAPTAAADLEAKYGPRIDGQHPTRVYVIEVAGRAAGFIQWTPASEYASWPSELGLDDGVALDGLLGEASLVGRGLAPRVLSRFLTAAPGGLGGATRVIGETATENVAMCRTLERAGFECVYEGDLERDGKRNRRVYVYSLPTASTAEAD